MGLNGLSILRYKTEEVKLKAIQYLNLSTGLVHYLAFYRNKGA